MDPFTTLLRRLPALALALALPSCGSSPATSSAASTAAGAGGATSATGTITGGGGNGGASSGAGGGATSTTSGAGGTTGTGGDGGASTGTGGGAGGGTCAGDPACVCPDQQLIAGYGEHDGLRAIDASHFALVDTGTWAAYSALIDGLGLPFAALDALPLNRTGTKPTGALAAALSTIVGYQGAFTWESGDQSVTYWVPQGLTGGTAGAREYVIVSWHYDEAHIADDPNPPASGDKGVRLSFADVSGLGGDVPYRHVLLVEPNAASGFVSVNIHAGGLAFYGPYLYVADTSKGVRVFDTTRLMATSSAAMCSGQIGKVGNAYCAYGYSYALPQVGGFYYPAGTHASCRAKFSFLSLDATTNPPSLVSGEYDNDVSLGIYSRLLRFPLDPGTSRLAADGAGAAHASEAFYAGNRNVQGAASVGGKFFLNATRYSGALSTGKVNQASKVYKASAGKWAYMPEGIHHAKGSGRLYVNTEGSADMTRLVFATKASAIP
ncbi:MAG: hypothetical protein U0359_13710 [Byssovorax sp.]